jgi:hypothetical protein
MAGVVAWRIDHAELVPVWVLVTGVGSWLVFIDWRTRLLPYVIVAPTYLATLLLVGLGALLLHTGGRLGSGLNFLLSLFFLAPAFMGVLAGNLIAKENERGAGGVAQRRRWVWLHLLLLWPLPVLLAFHVVQGYMF